jgi:hypothetical protein
LIVAENEREMLRVRAIDAGGDVMAEKARFLVECAISRENQSSLTHQLLYEQLTQ